MPDNVAIYTVKLSGMIRGVVMRVVQFFSIILLAVVSSFVVGESKSEENQIIALESEWSNMFGKQDLDGVMSLMAENSVLIMPGAAPIVGLDEIRQATKMMFESDGQVSWKSDFVRVSSSGDMAYDYGTATTKLADGSTVGGYYLVVWVKEDGEWKIAADMFN